MGVPKYRLTCAAIDRIAYTHITANIRRERLWGTWLNPRTDLPFTPYTGTILWDVQFLRPRSRHGRN